MQTLSRLSSFIVVVFAIVSAGQAQIVRDVHSADGFKTDLVYAVPREQGSWVSLTQDDRGRLISCDQYGKLYRITLAADDAPPKVEAIPLPIGFAQGLLYAFDSLYVMANEAEGRPAGLYRVRDTNGDDVFDSVTLLRKINGGGEHGPHAIILSPDRKSLLVCAGNHTALPDPETSLVPRLWQEDQLLPRIWDPGGHAVGIMAPGGWICRTDPEGKQFQLVSVGFRNEYDIALNEIGELFTYDADMEWDIGTPWYRPTRVCHVTPGSEFGWRSGNYKWPDYYPDSRPSVVDIGPGSPTGIVFGTGAAFPEKYQRALFICDWSYGIVYAVHLEPQGASYRGTTEIICSAPALQAADIVVGKDGAIYFVTGGRRTESALYRIRYVGDESTAPAAPAPVPELFEVRRRLESIAENSGADASAAVEQCWPYLGHADRAIRFAARTALERQPVDSWVQRCGKESNPSAMLQAVLALARAGTAQHRSSALQCLSRLNWNQLDDEQRQNLLRDYALIWLRLGQSDDVRQAVIQQVDRAFPCENRLINRELARLLAAIGAPNIVPRAVQQLKLATTQEDQIHYACLLRVCKNDWTPGLRRDYFEWFLKAASLYGGNSFNGYIQAIRKDAIENLTDAQRKEFADLIERQPENANPYAELKSRPVVKNWKADEIVALVDDGHRDLANGKQMFVLAQCYKCHRFAGEGGYVGPDLTGISRRYSRSDLVRSLVDPNNAVSDQYQATRFTLSDGRSVVGRVVNLSGNQMLVQTDMLHPANLTALNVDQIEEMLPSKVSMMPEGLLDTLSEKEILDLIAYLRSADQQ